MTDGTLLKLLVVVDVDTAVLTSREFVLCAVGYETTRRGFD